MLRIRIKEGLLVIAPFQAARHPAVTDTHYTCIQRQGNALA